MTALGFKLLKAVWGIKPTKPSQRYPISKRVIFISAIHTQTMAKIPHYSDFTILILLYKYMQWFISYLINWLRALLVKWHHIKLCPYGKCESHLYPCKSKISWDSLMTGCRNRNKVPPVVWESSEGGCHMFIISKGKKWQDRRKNCSSSSNMFKSQMKMIVQQFCTEAKFYLKVHRKLSKSF